MEMDEFQRKKFNYGVLWAKAALLAGKIPSFSSFNIKSNGGRWILRGIIAEAFAGKYGRMTEEELKESAKAIFE